MPASAPPLKAGRPASQEPGQASSQAWTIQPVVTRLTIFAVLLLFGVSQMMLAHWGINYDTPGGSVPEKIHPGSWLLGIALALHLFARPNPFRFIDQLAGRYFGTLAFLGGWLVLLFQIIVVQKVPFTPIIDTFLLPVMVLILCAAMPDKSRAWLAAALHLLMAVNAVIGFVEVASGERLTPFYLEGVIFEGEWRATALLGHPLGNACLTASYILLIRQAGTPGLHAWMRVPQIVLQLAAMTAFGGRTALVGVIAILLAAALWQALRYAGGGVKVNIGSLAATAIALPAAAFCLMLAVEFGLFDRLIERFMDDQGSANTRLVMLDVLFAIPLNQLIIGPDQALVETLKIVEGLELGIESFWVAFALRYGLLVSAIFFVSLAVFMVEVARAGGRATLTPIVFFFAIASTSVSLSAKSPLFGMFVALLMILPARPPRQDGS